MRLRTVCRKARSSARRIASLQDRLLLYKGIDLAKGNILVVWADDSAMGQGSSLRWHRGLIALTASLQSIGRLRTSVPSLHRRLLWWTSPNTADSDFLTGDIRPKGERRRRPYGRRETWRSLWSSCPLVCSAPPPSRWRPRFSLRVEPQRNRPPADIRKSRLRSSCRLLRADRPMFWLA